MKIILTITALLALSSISLLAAGEDWTAKYERLDQQHVPKGMNASALTAAGSGSQTTNSFTAENMRASNVSAALVVPTAGGSFNSHSAQMSKASSISAALVAPTTGGSFNSHSAQMSKASSVSAALVAPTTRGGGNSFSSSAAPAHSSGKTKRDQSGNRPNLSRGSELNPPK